MYITEPAIAGYERVVHFSDDTFSAYIALHNIRLGPALGGCRIRAYNNDDEALADVLNLSKGMSYKNSLAGLWFGGGKCVINAPRATPEIMHKIGEAVEYLKGQYITAEDVGTTVEDMRIAAENTSFIASLGAAGDPSPWTAMGVYSCIYSILDHYDLWLTDDVSIWVEGLGKVGWAVTELLNSDQIGELYVSDILTERVGKACEQFVVEPRLPASLPDITLYVPCAMGQVVTYENVHHQPTIICGSANNQLVDDELALILHTDGITFCPDFLVNAGGVIAVAAEITGFDTRVVESHVQGLGQRLIKVVEMAERDTSGQLTPLAAAKMLAEARWAA